MFDVMRKKDKHYLTDNFSEEQVTVSDEESSRSVDKDFSRGSDRSEVPNYELFPGYAFKLRGSNLFIGGTETIFATRAK